MKRFIKIAALGGLAAIILFSTVSCSKESAREASVVESTKKERNFMNEGTALYSKQRYAEAEISYNKALGENPDNKVAKFNLASAYIKQRGEDADSKGDSLMSRANGMLAELSAASEPEIAHAAFYDRGNLSYKGEDYASAVEHFKNALRRDPTDNAARENLRLAQLKLQQQQQNQDKNQDKNQDQQDQNKDQQQDKKDQQQDQQDQNKDQNKDQQDQQNQDKKEQPQKPQQQNGGLSDANAQQILKAMEDKENATRQKLEKMKQGKAAQSSRRQPEKPW